MGGSLREAGTGADVVRDVAGALDVPAGATVTARPCHLTPLAVTRKISTQMAVNKQRNVASVCKKRLHMPRVHKTISVSTIFIRSFPKREQPGK
jgi:hypothetical protein